MLILQLMTLIKQQLAASRGRPDNKTNAWEERHQRLRRYFITGIIDDERGSTAGWQTDPQSEFSMRGLSSRTEPFHFASVKWSKKDVERASKGCNVTNVTFADFVFSVLDKPWRKIQLRPA